MRPSLRALFLIFCGSILFHASPLSLGLIIGGYLATEELDKWIAKRARTQQLGVIAQKMDDINFGWQPCKDDPESEERGEFTRVRLIGQNQIVAARVAELLKEML